MPNVSPPPDRPEPPGPPVISDTNPYIGPRPFEEKDSNNFFGRSKEIRQLASLVVAHRAVLFYAQSGAGKTSLLQAGLVPRLREHKKIFILPICRVGGDLPPGILRSEVKNIYVFNMLLSLLGQDVDPRDLIGLSLVEGLKPFFAAQHSLDQVRPTPRLLILDQFEELFTTHQDRYPERANFFFQLQQALGVYPQLSLLLVMREDHIAHLDPYTVQMPDRLRIRYRMERLQYEVALEAVQEPADRAGCGFTPGVAEGLVDNLRRIQGGALPDAQPTAESAATETVIRLERPLETFTASEQEALKAKLAVWLDLSPEQISIMKLEEGSVILTTQLPPTAARTLAEMVAAGDPRLAEFRLTGVTLPPTVEDVVALGAYVEPVHLQIVCRQLWASLPPGREQIVAADVQEFGDVDQALIDFYDQALVNVMQQTLMSQRLVRLWFDIQLITPARTRGVVHRGPEETAGLPNAAIDILNNAYIIRADVRGHEMWYELTHDRLIEPILTANRQWLATYHNPLAAAYKAWLAAGRDPQKLLKGTQLDEAETYARNFPVDVTEEEEHFLAESRYQARQAARRRRNLIWATVAVIIMLSLCAVSAWISADTAEKRLYDAQTAQARADQQKARAEAAGGTAIAAGYNAATAAAEALSQRDRAATARAQAEQNELAAQAAAATAAAEENRAATAAMEARFQEGQANQQKATAQAAGGTALAERDKAATAEAISNQQKATAQAAGQTAIAERDLAATAQAEAEQQRAAAEAARAEAEAQRAAALAAEAQARQALEDAQAAEATAQAERDNAEAAEATAQAERDIAEEERRKALASSLAGLALAAYDSSQQGLAMLLSMEAIRLDDTPETRGSLLTILQKQQVMTTSLSHVTNAHSSCIEWSNHPDCKQVDKVAFSPDGKTLASVGWDQKIKLWKVLTNTLDSSPINTLDTKQFPRGVVFRPDTSDGKTLLATGHDKGVTLWDVSNPQSPITLTLTGHIRVSTVAFSPDGQTLASGGWDYDPEPIILWDVSDLQQSPIPSYTLSYTQIPPLFEERLQSVPFRPPDGHILAAGGYDNKLSLWNVENPNSPKVNFIFENISSTGNSDIYSLAFSPDGHLLAVGASDSTIILWDFSDPQNPTPLGKPLAAHKDGVRRVTFSPDGQLLASASYDWTIILWNVSNPQGAVLQVGRPLERHSDWVIDVAFSPDGKLLASGDIDGQIILWDMRLDSWTAVACNNITTRPKYLTSDEWNQFIGSDYPYKNTCAEPPTDH